MALRDVDAGMGLWDPLDAGMGHDEPFVPPNMVDAHVHPPAPPPRDEAQRERERMWRRMEPAFATLHVSLRRASRMGVPEELARGLETIERQVMEQMMRPEPPPPPEPPPLPPEPPPLPPHVAALEGALGEARAEREANAAEFAAASDARVAAIAAAAAAAPRGDWLTGASSAPPMRVEAPIPQPSPRAVSLALLARLTGFGADSQACAFYLDQADGDVEAAVRAAVQGSTLA